MAENGVDIWNLIFGAATVIATGATAIYQALEYRRRRQEADPIVEVKHYPLVNGQLVMALVLRNKLPETLVLTRIEVLRPRRAQISSHWINPPEGDRVWDEFQMRAVDMEAVLAPVGTPPSHGVMRLVSPNESLRVETCIRPPVAWNGGDLLLLLTVCTRSAIPRERHIKVRRDVRSTANQCE